MKPRGSSKNDDSNGTSDRSKLIATLRNNGSSSNEPYNYSMSGGQTRTYEPQNHGNIFNYTEFPKADSNHEDTFSIFNHADSSHFVTNSKIQQQNDRSMTLPAWTALSGTDAPYRRQSQPASDLVFRSTNSTRRAAKELAERRYEAMQRKKATILSVLLIAIASTIFYVSNTNYNLGTNLQKKGIIGSSNLQSSSQLVLNDNSTIIHEQQEQNQKGELNIDSEPPPQEEVIEPGKEFLQPFRYFADLETASRKSDSNFFFHVPRSGGQTIKDIIGKCLQKTLASEVGVREGHGQDETLQVIDYNEAKYVNVDTTSIDGLHRAAAMGLAPSGLSDVIASSYFREVGMLFDLHHKGRAFILLRDPMERAVSMYYYKTQSEVPMIDPSVTLEDYAQGNGIENSKFIVSNLSIFNFVVDDLNLTVLIALYLTNRLGNSLSHW